MGKGTAGREDKKKAEIMIVIQKMLHLGEKHSMSWQSVWPGCRGTRTPGLSWVGWVPNRPGFVTGRWQNPKAERWGGDTRKESISVRPAPRRWRTHVSKTICKAPPTLPGLCKENVGRDWWARPLGSKGQVDHRPGVSPGGSRWLRAVLVPWGGSFGAHQGMLFLQGLLPESRDELERT